MDKLDILDIMELLPHRYPNLYIDTVVELEPGKYGKALKNVTINEPYFQGHFPERPILPGIVIVEALAQLTALVYASVVLLEEKKDKSLSKKAKEKVGYLTKVNVKFKHLVYPGDQLLLFSEIGKKFGRIMQIGVKAMVDKKIVADGEIFVSEREG